MCIDIIYTITINFQMRTGNYIYIYINYINMIVNIYRT
jgi:hypothetical protein